MLSQAFFDIDANLPKNIKSLILEQTRNPQRAGLIEEVIKDCEKQMAEIKGKITELKSSDNIEKSAKAKIKNSIEILEEIILNKALDNAHLHMILYNIVVAQPDGGESIDLKFELKAPLKSHTVMHEFMVSGDSTDEDKLNGLDAS